MVTKLELGKLKMNKATEALQEIEKENSFEKRVDRAMKTTHLKQLKSEDKNGK